MAAIEGDDTAFGEFGMTHGMGVDSQGNVYTADVWSNRISKFDNQGNFITAWGKRGQDDGAEFNFPRFVAVDSHDDVYVASDGDIRKFDRHGNFIKLWGEQVKGETTCGYTRCARGMAFDSQGNIYVSKIHENRIQRIDAATGALSWFGVAGNGPGQMLKPWGVAIRNDLIYVAEWKNHRVQVLTLNGDPVSSFGSRGSGPGQFAFPTGIAVDAAGRIFVGDSGNGRIQVFDANGSYLTEWGTRGSGPGQFTEIHGMALDALGDLFVSDWKNVTVQKFGTGKLLPPAPDYVGRPNIAFGDDRAAFLWRDGVAPDWHLRVSALTGQHIRVNVIAHAPPAGLSLVGVPSGAVVPQEFGFTLDVVATGSEAGVDFQLPATAGMAVAVSIDGEYNPGMLRVGAQRDSPNPSGWVVPAVQMPDLPAYQRSVDIGTFAGRNANGLFEVALSADENRLRTDVQLMSSTRLLSARGVSIDRSDTLTVDDNSVFLSAATKNGYDGFLAGTSPDAMLYLSFTVQSLFQPQYLNHDRNPYTYGLGLPNAVMIPGVSNSWRLSQAPRKRR